MPLASYHSQKLWVLVKWMDVDVGLLPSEVLDLGKVVAAAWHQGQCGLSFVSAFVTGISQVSVHMLLLHKSGKGIGRLAG